MVWLVLKQSLKGFGLKPSQIAALSLLLEVSSFPKSGNVDRMHDTEDLKFEHFIFSTVSAFPAFVKAERKDERIGELILEAVSRSVEVTGKNVHFGAFMLLIPLIYSGLSSNSKPEGIAKKAKLHLKFTTPIDSINVLRAFKISNARAMRVKNKDLSTIDEVAIERGGLNLYKWLKLSPKENVVAMELLKGYPASISGYKIILNCIKSGFSLNDAITYTYHKLLSTLIDPLIIAKHGYDVALKVKEQAREAVKNFENEGIEAFYKFDARLRRDKINPGSIADITVSSIYLALISGSESKLI